MYVARKEQESCIKCFGGEDLLGKYLLEDLGVDGRIILKWIFKSGMGRDGLGFIWLRIGSGGGLM